METEYRREMNRNYMVIRPEAAWNEKYTLRMLSGNRIHGLLPFHDKIVDGEVKYYYDITSKQPLDRILEHRTMPGPELRTFMTELLFALKQMERFLLDESQLVLRPEYIYLDPGTCKASFCLVPGMHREFAAEFCELSQYLLDHVNHSDGDAVVLAFSIFKECRKLNFGIDDIEQCLRKTEVGERPGASRCYEKDMEDKRRNENGDENALLKRQMKKPLKDLGTETESGLPMEEEKTLPPPRIAATGLAGMLGIGMALLPAAIFMWRGFRGLYRWKWILLAVEILSAICIVILLYLRPDERKGMRSKEEKNRSNPKKEGCRNEGLFGWSSFPDTETEESFYEEEPWEIHLRDSEEMEKSMFPMGLAQYEEPKMKFEGDEDEIQTVLLRARPIYKENRKLVSVSDGKEIPIGYFPFLIGKNRELTDYCLNKPGVSRLHIKLEEKEEGYTVTDLNSTNGTSVNGHLLDANETTVLMLGDELMVAGERFYFR